MYSERIAVLLTDMKQKLLSEMFVKKGYNAVAVAPDTLFHLETADAAVFPLPLSRNGADVDFDGTAVSLDNVLSRMRRGAAVLGGYISPAVRQKTLDLGLNITDYYENESLVSANALVTAEGAVEIALKNLDVALYSSKILIVGYGRIAKFCARILKGFNADITVAARKKEARTAAALEGFSDIDISGIAERIGDFDLLINTVPSPVINKAELDRVKNCFLLDLASKPGGIDFSYAKEKNIPFEWALALPVRTAYITATEIVFNTLEDIIGGK